MVGLSEGTWADFLGAIADKLPKLRSIRLNLVGQVGMFHRVITRVKVGFNVTGADVTSYDDDCITPEYTISDNFDINSKLGAAIEAIVVNDDDFRRAHRNPEASDSDVSSNSDLGDSEDFESEADESEESGDGSGEDDEE